MLTAVEGRMEETKEVVTVKTPANIVRLGLASIVTVGAVVYPDPASVMLMVLMPPFNTEAVAVAPDPPPPLNVTSGAVL